MTTKSITERCSSDQKRNRDVSELK